MKLIMRILTTNMAVEPFRRSRSASVRRVQLIVKFVFVVPVRVMRSAFAVQTLNFRLLGEHGHCLS